MSKYCIYWDRPAARLAVDDESFGGCTIFGVHHDCAKCPNLIEMGGYQILLFDDEFRDILRHFYELGRNARKK